MPYGKSSIFVEIPSHNLLGILSPTQKILENPVESLQDALISPKKVSSFQNFLPEKGNVLIIVNDHTRSTPTATILDHILSKLNDQIIPTFIVATGIHRSPTEEELKMIFGRHLEPNRKRILIHDCQDPSHVYLGRTSRGTYVYMNKIVFSFEKIIIIGSVEPHYHAGMTGGRKGIFPGLAGFTTIEENHKLAMEPGSQMMNLDGNPVSEDLQEMIEMISEKDIFGIMAVSDPKGRFYGIFAGSLKESFSIAVKKARKTFGVEITQQVDIVVAVAAPPLDINLYQAHKAIEHGKQALKPGGTLILVAECSEGVGPTQFVDLLSTASDPKEIERICKENYRLGYHKAAKIADLATWAQIWAVSNLDSDTLEKAFIKKRSSLQIALDKALRRNGKDSKILIILEAGFTVPIISSNSS